MGRPKKETPNINPKNSSLLEKIIKNSNSDMAAIISKSSFFNDVRFVKTDIPILNLALSGKFDAGFSGGLITIAAPPKHFKSALGLKAMKSFQEQYENGIVIFYDSEGGITSKYLKNFGIDTDRVVHDFILDVEDLKSKMVTQLEGLQRNEPVMFFIDSLGNLSSQRELNNALEQKTSVDFTRAKEIRSFSRLVNGRLKIKNIPCILINHSYDSMDMFPTQRMGGGKGAEYSSDTIWMISRSQDKNNTTKEIEGWFFKIKADKSRFVKEKSEFELCVKYSGGIQKYSGLADYGVDVGVLEKIHGGYKFKELEISEKQIGVDDDFWNKVFNESDFKTLVENSISLGNMPQEEVEEEV